MCVITTSLKVASSAADTLGPKLPLTNQILARVTKLGTTCTLSLLEQNAEVLHVEERYPQRFGDVECRLPKTKNATKETSNMDKQCRRTQLQLNP